MKKNIGIFLLTALLFVGMYFIGGYSVSDPDHLVSRMAAGFAWMFAFALLFSLLKSFSGTKRGVDGGG